MILAASVGSALEWYDFFLYGTAAALVFGELFFPKSDPIVGTLLAFLTFGVGFVVRPVAAARASWLWSSSVRARHAGTFARFTCV